VETRNEGKQGNNTKQNYEEGVGAKVAAGQLLMLSFKAL